MPPIIAISTNSLSVNTINVRGKARRQRTKQHKNQGELALCKAKREMHEQIVQNVVSMSNLTDCVGYGGAQGSSVVFPAASGTQ